MRLEKLVSHQKLWEENFASAESLLALQLFKQIENSNFIFVRATDIRHVNAPFLGNEGHDIFKHDELQSSVRVLFM